MKIEEFLAPWEYNPALPPQIVAAHELKLWWNGSEQNAAALVLEWPPAGRTVHLKLPDDEASWALSIMTPRNFSPHNFLPSRPDLQKRAEKAIRSARLWRRFSMESPRSNCDLAAFVGVGGVCFWSLTATGRAFQPVRFVLQDAHLFQPPLELQRCLIKALKIPTSDAVFARDWLFQEANRKYEPYHPIKPTQTGRLLFDCSNHAAYTKKYEARQKLFALLARALGPPVSESQKRGGISVQSVGLTPENWREQKLDVFPDTPELHFWARLLLHFGPLRVEKSRFQNHLLIRDFCAGYNQGFRADILPFSDHEKREARLALASWARENLPREILAEALSILKIDGPD